MIFSGQKQMIFRSFLSLLKWPSFFTLLLFSFSACGPSYYWGLNYDCHILKNLKNNPDYEKPSPYDDPAVDYTKKKNKRSPYSQLFEKIKYKDQYVEKGCFVVKWPNPEKPGKKFKKFLPIILTDNGLIKSYSDITHDFSAKPKFEFSPDDLKEKKVEWFLFIIRHNQKGIDNIAEHRRICNDISEPHYNCFPYDELKNEKNACWFYLKLKPNGEFVSIYQIKNDEKGTCRICSREICGNKKDDDCDGVADEGCQPNDCHHLNRTRSCFEGSKKQLNTGICHAGKVTCLLSPEATKGIFKEAKLTWGACTDQQLPNKEECNGLDDDCNGQIDEGLANCCQVGEQQDCYEDEQGNPLQGNPKVGICRKGKRTCILDPNTQGGTWSKCLGAQGPKAETCNGLDDDCDGKVDQNLSGQQCDTGKKGPCKKGTLQCQHGQSICVPNILPTTEVCDGKDNNCDGNIDEIFPKKGLPCTLPGKFGPCAKGIYSKCEQGKPVCVPTRIAEKQERCGNGIDDDCDGKIDEQDSDCKCKVGETRKCFNGKKSQKNQGECKEGTQTCLIGGYWSRCVGEVLPSTEICNGKDDDCDGQTDEDFPLKGQRCFIIGKKGPCRYGIYRQCGKNAPICDPDIKNPSKNEICNNGIDDNCNGIIDENCTCTPHQTQSCYNGPQGSLNRGICHQGQQTCSTAGHWGGCLNEQSPASIEVCNGKDDDCDGKTDEEDPELGKSCIVPGAKGICREGIKKCEPSGRGAKIQCVSKYKKRQEICNGKDDDCDGQIDEDDPLLDKACTVRGQKGNCAIGSLKCLNKTLKCQPNQAKPKKEICNGLDDDCDGIVDNHLDPHLCPNQKGVCKKASQLCAGVSGWQKGPNNEICTAGDYYRNNNFYEVSEQTCDGRDNDCDGNVDKDSQGQTFTRPCYSGPPMTKGVGICKAGVQTCRNGWQNSPCENQVLPQQEVCGNNKDDNCNGYTDEKEVCSCWGLEDKDTLLVKAKTSIALDTITRPNHQYPDIVHYKLISIESQGKTLNVKPTSGLPKAYKVLKKGDEILILHLQGAVDRVGTYTFARIESLNGNTITLKVPLQNVIFGEKNNDDLKGQTVNVIRVPHYKSVFLQKEAILNVAPWNGTNGGVLVFRVSGAIKIMKNAQISVQGCGYRGGTSVSGVSSNPRAGESPSGWPKSSQGKDGGGFAPEKNGTIVASGGGGAHRTAGQSGKDMNGTEAIKGGEAYSHLDEDRLRFGSGGGSGAGDSSSKGQNPKNLSGAGGAGGGILLIFAQTIDVYGEIRASGQKGGDGFSYGGTVAAGGGGAGGSLLIYTQNLIFRKTASLNATGGKGGLSSSGGPKEQKRPFEKSQGGQGGDGLIQLHIFTLNGTDPKKSSVDPVKICSPIPKLSNLPKKCLP